MKVLVTGFDPFGGDKVNPAYEAVKKMPDEISGAEIIKVEVPTVFEKSRQVVKEAIQQHQPDVVIWAVSSLVRTCRNQSSRSKNP